jgi:hypothetical protein
MEELSRSKTTLKKGPEQGVQNNFDEIQTRIKDRTLFSSERDQRLASDLFNGINERHQSHEINDSQYEDALAGLNVLVPRRSNKGWRVVADINVSPMMESTIKSRVDSNEHEITRSDGSWGMLPLEVRQGIAKRSNMIIEMTGTCTVRCSFCALAEKGPIVDKISLSSLAELFRFYRDNQTEDPVIIKSDNLYWGTDPFDAKWKSANGEDYDYSNVAETYWNTMKGIEIFVYLNSCSYW